MDDVFFKTLLYDFYGELLTKNQKRIMDMYYNQDLALSEISENISVTRQGVYDTLKRAESTLAEYENKLKMVERFISHDALFKKINLELDNILNGDYNISNDIKCKLIEIKNIIKKII